MKEYSGVLFTWAETGTEGSHWALQDFRHITENENILGGYAWSYEGLVVIQGDDELTIYDHDKKIVWEGVVRLKTDEKHYLKYGCHHVPTNVDFEAWAEFFTKDYTAKLRRP